MSNCLKCAVFNLDEGCCGDDEKVNLYNKNALLDQVCSDFIKRIGDFSQIEKVLSVVDLIRTIKATNEVLSDYEDLNSVEDLNDELISLANNGEKLLEKLEVELEKLGKE
jgi:hypothetical protein